MKIEELIELIYWGLVTYGAFMVLGFIITVVIVIWIFKSMKE